MKLYTEEQLKLMIDDAHNGVDGYYDKYWLEVKQEIEKL
jgi:hypothetical protein